MTPKNNILSGTGGACDLAILKRFAISALVFAVISLPQSLLAQTTGAAVNMPDAGRVAAIPAPAPVAAPATGTSQGAAPTVIPKVVAGDVQPDADKAPSKKIPNSLFLTEQDHIRISNAIAQYQLRLTSNVKDDGDKGKVAPAQEEEPKYFIYPQFFLESLVYHSQDDWLIQINGQKILPNKPSSQLPLVVVGIDNERVLLSWRPKDMSKVLEVWDKRNTPTEITKIVENKAMEVHFDDKVNPQATTALVTVNRDQNIVLFYLHSNQTFSSFSMQILEGKILPVRVELFKKEEDKGKIVSVDDPKMLVKPPPSVDNIPVDEGNAGLDALMKKVQKQSEENKNNIEGK